MQFHENDTQESSDAELAKSVYNVKETQRAYGVNKGIASLPGSSEKALARSEFAYVVARKDLLTQDPTGRRSNWQNFVDADEMKKSDLELKEMQFIQSGMSYPEMPADTLMQNAGAAAAPKGKGFFASIASRIKKVVNTLRGRSAGATAQVADAPQQAQTATIETPAQSKPAPSLRGQAILKDLKEQSRESPAPSRGLGRG